MLLQADQAPSDVPTSDGTNHNKNNPLVCKTFGVLLYVRFRVNISHLCDILTNM